MSMDDPEHGEDCECCANGLESFLEKVDDLTQRFGFAVVAVDNEAAMSYTVGLTALGLPEIVVFGLPQDVARHLLNAAGTLLRERRLPTDTPVEEIANLPLVFKSIPADVAEENLRVAAARAKGPIAALQMIFPDPKGLFPWEAGFAPHLALTQPTLYRSFH